ncbi:hypothetical protein PO124_33310 [Bacillus licheniformis]|nr:hypothetical protein [Bacillus licheniformis]
MTELGNAERIVYYHGKNIRYCNELDWLIWNGKRWEEDSKRKLKLSPPRHYGRCTARLRPQKTNSEKAAERLGEEMRAPQHTDEHNFRCSANGFSEEAGTGFPQISFNCDNGVIDLKQANFCRMIGICFHEISPISYQTDADCPNWKTFLESIL